MLGVSVGAGVKVGTNVEVGGTDVLLGCGESVKGSAVSVRGSVGSGEAVIPGRGVGEGVRVGPIGTHKSSPAKIRSLGWQLTLFNKAAEVL